jgi:mutator protein MutT
MSELSLDPERPLVGVAAVVVREGSVLLVRRGKEPLRGRWSLPGGAVERGETLHEALVRELREETGLIVRPLELLTVVDRIERADGRVSYHYVIVDYLCEPVSGRLAAASDADDAVFALPEELQAYDLTPAALEVVRDGLRRMAGRRAPPRE